MQTDIQTSCSSASGFLCLYRLGTPNFGCSVTLVGDSAKLWLVKLGVAPKSFLRVFEILWERRNERERQGACVPCMHVRSMSRHNADDIEWPSAEWLLL